MNKIKIGFIILLIPLLAFVSHKYYISSTKIEFKKESETVQITMHFFIDDLQETINSTYNKNIELALPNESKLIDSLIINYISKKFEVDLNGINRDFLYIGKEYKIDEIYLYLEMKNIEAIKSIEVKNNMLMETFPDQQNIIQLYINNIKKTFLLTRQKDNDLFNF
jgi:hypothetical protein